VLNFNNQPQWPTLKCKSFATSTSAQYTNEHLWTTNFGSLLVLVDKHEAKVSSVPSVLSGGQYGHLSLLLTLCQTNHLFHDHPRGLWPSRKGYPDQCSLRCIERERMDATILGSPSFASHPMSLKVTHSFSSSHCKSQLTQSHLLRLCLHYLSEQDQILQSWNDCWYWPLRCLPGCLLSCYLYNIYKTPHKQQHKKDFFCAQQCKYICKWESTNMTYQLKSWLSTTSPLNFLSPQDTHTL